MISRDSKAVGSGQAGFTLIELAVALGVTAIVMLGILFLFDFNNKLTRVQSNVADMQQSLRIAQYDMVRMVRMAGRGGLVPAGGLTIADNVPAGTRINGNGTPPVLAGTDILTLRGVFSTPIFQVAFTNPGAFVRTPGTPAEPEPKDAEGGIIELCDKTPAGAEQALDILRGRLSDAEQRLILVSPLDDRFFVVVRLDPEASDPDSTETCKDALGRPTGLTVGFKIERDGAPGDPYRYGPLSPKSNSDAELALKGAAYVGLLEEYRFYVKENYGYVAGAETSGLAPVLCRASFIGANPELCQEISDGVLDLQVALGLDTSNDGDVVENPANPSTDEWFGNSAGEIEDYDLTSPAYLTYSDRVNDSLKSLRISTLVHTRRPDNTYDAEVLDRLEDHDYPPATISTDPSRYIPDYNGDPVNSMVGRKYRRRLLQTIVNLRNLTT